MNEKTKKLMFSLVVTIVALLLGALGLYMLIFFPALLVTVIVLVLIVTAWWAVYNLLYGERIGNKHEQQTIGLFMCGNLDSNHVERRDTKSKSQSRGIDGLS